MSGCSPLGSAEGPGEIRRVQGQSFPFYPATPTTTLSGLTVITLPTVTPTVQPYCQGRLSSPCSQSHLLYNHTVRDDCHHPAHSHTYSTTTLSGTAVITLLTVTPTLQPHCQGRLSSPCSQSHLLYNQTVRDDCHHPAHSHTRCSTRLSGTTVITLLTVTPSVQPDYQGQLSSPCSQSHLLYNHTIRDSCHHPAHSHTFCTTRLSGTTVITVPTVTPSVQPD